MIYFGIFFFLISYVPYSTIFANNCLIGCDNFYRVYRVFVLKKNKINKYAHAYRLWIYYTIQKHTKICNPTTNNIIKKTGPRMGIGSSTLDHSRRSSISESSAISGFSSASNKTYVHEASTLVLETVENGVKR